MCLCRQPWGAEPRGRFEQCVEHFCSILVVTAQLGKGDGLVLSDKEITAFTGVKAAMKS